ncbi:helix-turn-helix transcriptional regulator [Streptomyces sp. NPDC006743]|uniref:helix-turn-helix transcriptional regulator n=1 Tax=Streptomyces sp. NPDC006743 TaxID=3154480 RepID=UPI0034557C88
MSSQAARRTAAPGCRRCRRDLADPAQQTVPLATIAARWGHCRPSDFTRAFRAATGMAPSEYRAAHADRSRQ